MERDTNRSRGAFSVLLRVVVCAILVAIVIGKVQWDDRVYAHDGTEWTVVSANGESLQVARGGETVRRGRDEVGDVRPGLLSIVRATQWGLGGAALLCALPIPLVAAARWRAILRAMDVSAPSNVITRVTLQHYLVNLVALGTAGGDMYRAAMLRADSRGWSRVLASLLVDRVAGLGAMAGVAVVGSVGLLGHPALGGIATVALVICVAAVVMGAVAVRILRSPWLASRGMESSRARASREKVGRWKGRVGGWLDGVRGSVLRLTDALRRISGDRRALVRIALLSLAGHGLLVAALWLEATALGLEHAFAAAVVVVPAAAAVALFTPTPQGMGAFEWGLVALLAPYETGGANRCLALAVGFRLITLCWTLPALAVWLSPGGRRRKGVTHEPVTAVQR